ncbi:hypothetical protein [Hyphomicrobium sp. 2TAF46]|uniref:hypothetical protein n=1 Tax=Hyphomicrobium sp. 2TAF46 TaxID=3233019 RepID=UPI003F938893
MAVRPSVVLIFGTSHVGKSTLAGRITEATSWPLVSTDSLARHPGRPWPQVKEPVAEYYSSLSDETIYWFLRAHHENMWPALRQKIVEACHAGQGLIVEGTALRPEYIAELDRQKVLTIGLYADRDFLRERMEAASGYSQGDDRTKLLIDKFIARSLRDDMEIVRAADRFGLRLVDAAEALQLDRVVEELASELASEV